MRRRICACISSFLIAAVMMSGCAEDQNSKSKSEDDGIQPLISEDEKLELAKGPISVYYDRKKLLDNDELDGTVPLAAYGESIWYYKQADIYGLYGTAKDVVSYYVDTESGAVEYDEQINVPVGNYIRYDDEKVVYWLCKDEKYTLNTLDLKSRKTETIDLEDEPRHTGTDDNGNIYVYIYSPSGGNLTVYDQKMNVSEKFSIENQLKDMGVTGRYVYGMCVSHDGNVYFSIDEKYVRSSIFTIDGNGKLKDLTGDIYDIGAGSEIFINSEGIITLCTGYGSVTFDTIDSKTGEVLYRYELNGIGTVFGHTDKYDMVYFDPFGICGYDYMEDRTDTIVTEDTVPGLSSLFDSGFMSGNRFYISVLDAGSNTLMKVNRSTGEITKSEIIGADSAAVSPDGTLYYLYWELKYRGADDGNTYDYVEAAAYRLNDDGTSEQVFTLPEYNGKLYPSSLRISDNGDFFVGYYDEEGIGCAFVYDAAGNLKTEIYQPDDGEGAYWIEPYVIRNEKGDIILNSSIGTCVIDPDTYEVRKISIEYQTDPYYVQAEKVYDGIDGYDLIYRNDSGFFGWKESENKSEELILFQDIEGKIDYEERNVFLNTDELVLSEGIVLKKADAERLAELNSRKIITLAVSGNDMKPLIEEFNAGNDEYRIIMKDYARYGRSLEYTDIGGDSEQLSKDIVSGDIPDIIMLDGMDVSSYITKGIFTDLKEFVDKDPELDMTDFYQNLTDEFVYNGCQYTIPAYNELRTLLSVYQPEEWNYSDMFSHEQINSYMFEYGTAYNMADYFLTQYINDHVELENSKCDFNNDVFIELLDYLKEYRNFTEEEYDEDRQSGTFDFMIQIVSNFSSYCDLTREYYDRFTPYAPGFPSEEGGKNYVIPQMMFGITNKCEFKEGAWEFIRQILNGSITEAIDYEGVERYLNCFSIIKTVNEDNIKKGIESCAEFEENAAGKADEYREFLNRPVFSNLIYSEVRRIVNEETDVYFQSEDITAEETAKAVQNKVMLYLNEIS